MATVGGQDIGTVLRKSMTVFIVSTADGKDVFMLELPDIFASQWSNISSMVITVSLNNRGKLKINQEISI